MECSYPLTSLSDDSAAEAALCTCLADALTTSPSSSPPSITSVLKAHAATWTHGETSVLRSVAANAAKRVVRYAKSEGSHAAAFDAVWSSMNAPSAGRTTTAPPDNVPLRLLLSALTAGINPGERPPQSLLGGITLALAQTAQRVGTSDPPAVEELALSCAAVR